MSKLQEKMDTLAAKPMNGRGENAVRASVCMLVRLHASACVCMRLHASVGVNACTVNEHAK